MNVKTNYLATPSLRAAAQNLPRSRPARATSGIAAASRSHEVCSAGVSPAFCDVSKVEKLPARRRRYESKLSLRSFSNYQKWKNISGCGIICVMETEDSRKGFDGLRVLTLESRRGPEMAKLIAANGGIATVAPS